MRRKPHVALAFNSGLHSPEHLMDWCDTIGHLKENHVPTWQCTYNAEEMCDDKSVLKVDQVVKPDGSKEWSARSRVACEG
ncbi:hypothetical protein WJX72_000569 [[Myrmecia] bisecta]|uniref:Mitochondrial splicing suppressor 51-like C-terminal domain-containing protein n=1 Tax=[Myrmecia] bisecta TaxID=41462 RepID=A0AAW1Q391_9CHLO